jgi:hypothetical protein
MVLPYHEPMNRQVNLPKRIRISNGLRFCPVVISANGRVKPDYVTVADKDERHPEGAYYLEWHEGSRRIRRSVGNDAITAAARRHQQEQILASKAAGKKLADEEKSDGSPVGDAAAIYLEEIKKTKKHKTYLAYKIALGYCLSAILGGRTWPFWRLHGLLQARSWGSFFLDDGESAEEIFVLPAAHLRWNWRRFGQGGVDDISDIGFVDAHAQGRRGHNDFHFFVDEGALAFLPFLIRLAGVIWCDPIAFFRQGLVHLRGF